MKNFLFLSFSTLLLSLFMTSCIKDKTLHTYTITRPEYSLKSTVYNAISSQAPQPITSFGKMYILGNTLFLCEAEKGVHIIDNANPAAPINKAFIQIPGIRDMVVKGNILLADCYIDLLSIDITDPMQAKLVNYLPNVFPDRLYVNGFYLDTSKVITSWITKDTTVEEGNVFIYSYSTANTTSSEYSGGTQQGKSGSMARFALQSNYLYTVSNWSLSVFDVNDAKLPVLKNTQSLGWNIETIYPVNDKLFIGSQSGMFIFSIASPTQPTQLATFQHATVCDPVIADNQYAFVTLRSGTTCQGFTNELNIIDIQQINHPNLVATYPMTNPHGLSKDGNLCFICDGSSGLKVYDVSNIQQIQLKQTIPMSKAYDVIAFNHHAYVTSDDGFYQFEYTTGDDLKLLSKMAK